MKRNSEVIKIEHCKMADREHREAQRQYAHVFHRKGVICVAKDFHRLPENLQLALLLHEMGHLYAGPRGGEDAANKQILKRAGIEIHYKNSAYGEDLEWIAEADNKKAKHFLGLLSCEAAA